MPPPGLDVVEGHAHAVAVEDAELAQARRVDEQAAGEADELPPRRRVPAARVVLADRGRLEERLARERVDDGRLADAGRAGEDDGPPRRRDAFESVQPLARHDRDTG